MKSIRWWRGVVLSLGVGAAACETQDAAEKPDNPAAAQGPMVPVASALAYDPKGVARQMRILDAFIQRGEQALKEEFVVLHASDPGHPASKFLTAYAREDRRAAWRDLDAVRKAYPGIALGYLGMLAIYSEWKLPEQAEQTYQKCVTLDPGLAVAHARLGAMYVAKGDLARGEALYRKALAVDPEDADALVGLARLQVSNGDKAGALKLLTQAAPLWPENAILAKDRAMLLEESGARKEAAEAYLLAAKLDRRPFETLMKAAVMLTQEGDRAGAEGVYLLALPHNPTNADLLLTLGTLASERGDRPAQMAFLARAVEQNPDDAELHRSLAAYFLERGENAGAERHLADLVRLSPNDQRAHLQLAQLALAQGKQKDVLEHYIDAAALGPLPDEDAARKDALEKGLNLPLVPASGATSQKVFDAALKSIIKAYQLRLKEKPGLSGGVTVEMEVSPEGRVTSIKLKDDSLGDEKMSTNIYFTMKRAVFPAGKKSRFSYPISFDPPKRGKK